MQDIRNIPPPAIVILQAPSQSRLLEIIITVLIRVWTDIQNTSRPKAGYPQYTAPCHSYTSSSFPSGLLEIIITVLIRVRTDIQNTSRPSVGYPQNTAPAIVALAAPSPSRLLDIILTLLIRVRTDIQNTSRPSGGYPQYTAPCYSGTCSYFPITPSRYYNDCFNTVST